MIAVLDSGGDGWGFVGMLHRQGFAVSWVVRRGVDVGFDALPSGFRGVVHPVGFEDVPQVRTAVRGCEAVVVFGDGVLESAERVVLQALGVPVFRAAGTAGGGYSVEAMEINLPAGRAPKAAVTTLFRHA